MSQAESGISRLEDALGAQAMSPALLAARFFSDFEALLRSMRTAWSAHFNDPDASHEAALRFLSGMMVIRLLQAPGTSAAEGIPVLPRGVHRSLIGSPTGGMLMTEDGRSVLGHLPCGISAFLSSTLIDEIPSEARTVFHDKAESLFARYPFSLSENRPFNRTVAITPEILGEVHERLFGHDSGAGERARAGVFYTPKTEIDLMCRLSIVRFLAAHFSDQDPAQLYRLVFDDRNTTPDPSSVPNDAVLKRMLDRLKSLTIVDPACGSGAFLIGMLDVLGDLTARIQDELNQPEAAVDTISGIAGTNLYGVDVKPWAVAVTRVRLELALLEAAGRTAGAAGTDQPRACAGEHQDIGRAAHRIRLHIRQGDALVRGSGRPPSDGSTSHGPSRTPSDQPADAEVPFVWENAFPDVFRPEDGGFDIVIGNPPYVRQEDISNPISGTGSGPNHRKDYKRRLETAVYDAFPDYFGCTRKTGRPPTALDRKSDLYVYFFYAGLRLLNSAGALCYVTSSSWLDVGYGRTLQDFLLRKTHLHFLIGSEVQRSFSAADVNTVITLAGAKPSSAALPADRYTRFVQLKAPFETVLNGSFWSQAEQHRHRVEDSLHRLNPVAFEALNPYTSARQKAAPPPLPSLNTRGAPGKWGGQYLRAPDLYWRILEKGAESLIPLKQVAAVRRGYTTGANEFFYLSRKEVDAWQIEKEFLFPLLKSPREARFPALEGSVRHCVFICGRERAELGGTRALRYIEWGESRGMHLSPSCAARPRWYSLNPHVPPEIVAPCSVNDRFRVFLNPSRVHIDKRLYEIHPSTEHVQALAASLNSTLTSFFLEIMTRTGLGEGLLDMTVYELQDCLIVDPQRVHAASARSTNNVQEPESDLSAVDDRVFAALGLKSSERSELFQAVDHLVRTRLEKAASISNG